MIIGIESYYGDKLIWGNKCSETELKDRFSRVISLTDEKGFSALFCSMYGFEQFEYSPEIRVDFRIDLDTHQIYKPQY
jgi:hypothetical protein